MELVVEKQSKDLSRQTIEKKQEMGFIRQQSENIELRT